MFVIDADMPKCCDECLLCYDGFICRATDTRFYPRNKDGKYLEPVIDTTNSRLASCPVKECVRCGDCVHMTWSSMCSRNDDWFPVKVSDFCSNGERMETRKP